MIVDVRLYDNVDCLFNGDGWNKECCKCIDFD